MRKIQQQSLLAIFAFTLFTLLHLATASVIGIDYGTDHIKGAVVAAKAPLAIVLTKDSKRKEAASIAFKHDERLFGTEAAALESRFPQDTFPGMKYLLGQRCGSQAVADYVKMHPGIKIACHAKRDVPIFITSNGKNYTTEELVAMELEHFRHLANDVSQEHPEDAVISVPASFAEEQIESMITAAKIAGLNPLAVVPDGETIAFNYVTNKRDVNGMEIFLDIGAGSTSAYLVDFSRLMVVEESGAKTKPIVSLKDSLFDKNISGNIFDHKIVEFALADINDRYHHNLVNDGKAIAKLTREAKRAKQILSANQKTHIVIESLFQNTDYRLEITRSQFEKLIDDAPQRAVKLIEELLGKSNKNIADIHSIVLVGGSSRVPYIKAALEKSFGNKIAQSVNADEAVAFGAAFHGARLSGKFRVKEIEFFADSSYDFVMREESKNSIETILFKNGQPGVIKNVSLDFVPDRKYEVVKKSISQLEGSEETKDSVQQGDVVSIGHFEVTNITIAMNQLQSALDCKSFSHELEVELDTSSRFKVRNVYLKCKESGKKDKFNLKKLFGKHSKSSSDTENGSASITPDTTTTATTSSKSTASTENVSTKVEQEEVPDHIKLPVSWQPSLKNIASPLEIISSRRKLTELHYQDVSRRLSDELRNKLEASVYQLKEFLIEEKTISVTTAAQRDKLAKNLEKLNDWLYGDGASAVFKELDKWKEDIEKLEKPIKERIKWQEEYPEYEKHFRDSMNLLSSMLETIGRLVSNATETANKELETQLLDVRKIETNFKEISEWFSTKTEQQKSIKAYEDPALTLPDLKSQTQKLDKMRNALLRKLMKIKPILERAAKSTVESSQKEQARDSSVKEKASSSGVRDSSNNNETTEVPSASTTADNDSAGNSGSTSKGEENVNSNFDKTQDSTGKPAFQDSQDHDEL